MVGVTWWVRAVVRKRGAIGVFVALDFHVRAAAAATGQKVREAWFAANGASWELHHFAGIRREDGLPPAFPGEGGAA